MDCIDILAFLLYLVHEGTLVHAVAVLTQWCQKFTTEVPKKLIEWFQKAVSLKTSTSGVRHSYFQCMLVSFRGEFIFYFFNCIFLTDFSLVLRPCHDHKLDNVSNFTRKNTSVITEI